MTGGRKSCAEGAEKVREKLKKLLRLSGSPNEHEAALAIEKAQELAMEHGIALASVSTEEQKAAVRAECIPLKKCRARNIVLALLRDHFSVGVATSQSRVFFFGTPEDITFAAYLLPFLIRQFKGLWGEARRRFGLRSETSYYEGLAYGISRRLRTVENEHAEWGLIVRDKKARIGEAMKDIPAHKARERNLSERELSAGNMDAAKVNLNRPLESRGANQPCLMEMEAGR